MVSLIAVGCGGSRTTQVEHALTRSLAAKGPVTCGTAFNGDVSCRSPRANGGHQDCTAINITSGAEAGQTAGSCHLPGRVHADAVLLADAVKRVGNLPFVGKPRSVSCAETPAGETWSCHARGPTARARCLVLARNHTVLVGLYCEPTR